MQSHRAQASSPVRIVVFLSLLTVGFMACSRQNRSGFVTDGSSACLGKLSVSAMASPSDPDMNQVVTWRILAALPCADGLVSSFRLLHNGQTQFFSGSISIETSYDSPGAKIETFTISALSADGFVIDTATVQPVVTVGGIMIDDPPPANLVVVNLTAEAVSSSQVKLNWNATPLTQVQGFFIGRRIVPVVGIPSDFYIVGAVPVGFTSFTDGLNPQFALDPGLAYEYVVLAADAHSILGASNLVLIAASTPAPRNLVAILIDPIRVKMGWESQLDPEGGFELKISIRHRSESKFQVQPSVAINGSDRQVNAELLNMDYFYDFVLYAKNERGLSAGSNTLSVPAIPLPPTNLRHTELGASFVRIKWDHNGDNITGFKIYRKRGTGDWKVIKTVDASVRSYRDSSLIPNTDYRYHVESYNTRGESQSEFPIEVEVVHTPLL